MRKHPAVKDELLSVVKGLPEESIAEVIDFAYYLRVKEKIRGREIEDFDLWAEKSAAKKGFSNLTDNEVAKIVMECRSESRAQA